MSLQWCCSSLAINSKCFYFFIVVNCFSSYFADYCQWHGPSILHATWFTLDPLQSCYCPKNLSHFHLQHSFSHRFQFLKLLFHFGFHRNHMSLLSSISNALTHCYLLVMMIAMFVKSFHLSTNTAKLPSQSRWQPLSPSVGGRKSWSTFEVEQGQ